MSKRNEQVRVRLSSSEKQELKDRADKSEMSMAEFIRASIQTTRIVPRDSFNRLARGTRGVQLNLKEIAALMIEQSKKVEQTRILSALVSIDRQMNEVLTTAKSILEEHPGK